MDQQKRYIDASQVRKHIRNGKKSVNNFFGDIRGKFRSTVNDVRNTVGINVPKKRKR